MGRPPAVNLTPAMALRGCPSSPINLPIQVYAAHMPTQLMQFLLMPMDTLYPLFISQRPRSRDLKLKMETTGFPPSNCSLQPMEALLLPVPRIWPLAYSHYPSNPLDPFNPRVLIPKDGQHLVLFPPRLNL